MAQDKNNSLLDNLTNIEPSGVMYNLKGSDIEAFVEDYFQKRGVPIDGTHLRVNREGANSPNMDFFIFINVKNENIVSTSRDIPEALRAKAADVNIELSDKLKDVVTALIDQRIEFSRAQGDRRYIYIKLNIFRILALMFCCEPGKHRAVVLDVRKIPSRNDDCIINFIKQIWFRSDNRSPNNDRFSKVIAELEGQKRYQ